MGHPRDDLEIRRATASPMARSFFGTTSTSFQSTIVRPRTCCHDTSCFFCLLQMRYTATPSFWDVCKSWDCIGPACHFYCSFCDVGAVHERRVQQATTGAVPVTALQENHPRIVAHHPETTQRSPPTKAALQVHPCNSGVAIPLGFHARPSQLHSTITQARFRKEF